LDGCKTKNVERDIEVCGFSPNATQCGKFATKSQSNLSTKEGGSAGLEGLERFIAPALFVYRLPKLQFVRPAEQTAA
jgi:hypothetical protein